MRTELCDRFGIDYHLCLTPELVKGFEDATRRLDEIRER